MGSVPRLPRTPSANLSSPEPAGRCPHCGRGRKIKSTELLGTTITIALSCGCELDAFEKEMQRIKNFEHRRRQEQMLRNSGLVYATNMTFGSFIPRSGTEKALQVAREFAADFEKRQVTGEGFVLMGDYGNGKSHLAAAVVHQLMGRGIPASYQVVPELLKRVRATFGGAGLGGGETEAGILELLQGVQCLVLDDVGAQRPTQWAEEFLYTVIDHRYRRRRPTIITTNCSGIDGERSLTEALGGRAVDRLLERNIIIKITATSYRRELAKQRLAQNIAGN